MPHFDFPTPAHGGPPLTARIRSRPEDFRVTEDLGFTPDGVGEHVLLRIRKRGLTTGQAADVLARFAGVKPGVVGYAGMKDRHAITEQSLTVQLPGREEPDWAALERDDVVVLDHARHQRKLKRGALKANHFTIRLRDVQGARERAEQVLTRIRSKGVPNYFGAQRFGRRGDNVEQARTMFAGRRVRRNQRSILLSAARSHIFNRVLDARVQDSTWNRGIDGELYSLAGSRSWFASEADTTELRQRIADGDIHPSGPLWGDGPSPASGDAGQLESRIAGVTPELCEGLANARLDHDRRALRLLPDDFSWTWPERESLELHFGLPPGAYATAVIAEIADTANQPG